MLLFLLAEEVGGQVPVQIVTDNITAAEPVIQAENETQEVPPPPPPPLTQIAVFGPVYERTIVSAARNGSGMSNASILKFSTGAAYDFSQCLTQLNNQTDVQVLTVVGEDSVAKGIIRGLEEAGIGVGNIERNEKFFTANLVEVIDDGENAPKTARSSKKAANGSADGDQDQSATQDQDGNNTKQESLNKSAVYSYQEIYERINYKYTYAHRIPLMTSKFIFMDGAVNENSIRYILEHAGYKTFALYRGADQGFKMAYFMPKIKAPQNASLGYFVTLDLAAAHTFSSTLCALRRSKDAFYQLCGDGIDFLEFFVQNYSRMEKRVPYGDYLMQYTQVAERHAKFLHTALRAQNVVIKLPNGAIYSIEGVGLIYSEHSCLSDKCRVSDYGSDESFLAGLMHSVLGQKSTEDAIEFAGMCEIASLKSPTSAVPELTERSITRLEQSNFVSKRWLADYTPASAENK